MRKLVVAIALLLVCVTVLYGCREPTQVTVRLTTDVSCGGDGFQGASLAVASQAALRGRAPTAATADCDPGSPEATIGTVVVVPSDGDDDAFSIRVVGGVGIPAEACPAPTYVLGPEDTAVGRGCIVARRSLSFISHTKLELPIVLRQTCLNVDCDAESTCLNGRCVSSKIDPEKCAEDGGCDENDLSGGSGGGSGMGGMGGIGGAGMGASGTGGIGAGGMSTGGMGGMSTGGMGTGGMGTGGMGGMGGMGTGGTGAMGGMGGMGGLGVAASGAI